MKKHYMLTLLLFFISVSIVVNSCFSQPYINTGPEIESKTVLVEPSKTPQKIEPTPTPIPSPEESDHPDLTKIGYIHFESQKRTQVDNCPDTQFQIGDWVILALAPSRKASYYRYPDYPAPSLWIRSSPVKYYDYTKIGVVRPGTLMKLVQGPICSQEHIYWNVEVAEGEGGWLISKYVDKKNTGWVAEANKDYHWFTPIVFYDAAKERYGDSSILDAYIQFLGYTIDEDICRCASSEVYDIYNKVGRDQFLDFAGMTPVYIEGYPDDPPITLDQLVEGAFSDISKMGENASLLDENKYNLVRYVTSMLGGVSGTWIQDRVFGPN